MTVALILAAKGREVIVTEPHRTLADTAALLASRNIGAAVVVDAQGRVVGIISERDIVRAIGTGGAKVLSEAVAEHMSAPVVTTQEDEHIHVAMELMTHQRHRHLPVMDGGKLVGIVSIGDVVKHRLEQIELEHQAMRDYIATA
jgi:CBS domain-containing protein